MEETKFYGMQNDYMFHAVLQKSPRVMKHLVCTLMCLNENEVTEVVLQNPIELGGSVSEKDCVLDIKAVLNGKKILNIELQIRRQIFWTERSILYWSRAYDHLGSGEDYGALKETCHIGILGFTPFPDNPEFYAEYRILSRRTQRCYSDKFCIRVLDVTQVDRAEEATDKRLVKWARVFRAKSLTELEVLAGDEEVFQEMVVTIKELSEEEKIRLQCEARFFYECDMASTRVEGFNEGVEQERQRSEEKIRALQKQSEEREAQLQKQSEEREAQLQKQSEEREAQLQKQSREQVRKIQQHSEKLERELQQKNAELEAALERLRHLEKQSAV